jgi:hypothetical protein
LRKTRPEIISTGHEGVLYFQASDPYIEAFFTQRLRQSLRNQGRDLLILLGSEINSEWVEENLIQVGLFSSKESYLVLCAEDLTEDVKKTMIKSGLNMSGRSLILCSWKGHDSLDKMSKKMKAEILKVQPPAFWEYDKLLDYLADEMQMPLSFPVKSYLLEALAPTCGEFVEAIKTIKLHADTEGHIELSHVQELIRPGHLKRFELAEEFAQKKQTFFSELLRLELADKELIEFFRFMQGHLLKMLDTSYADKKNRLSKYDKALMAHSRLWKDSQLKRAIHHFSELELMAKRKDKTLQEKMRQNYLAQFL